MTQFIGRSLGRYHILEQLGEGGMATVYKTFDTRLERDVAIKVIRRDAFPPSQLDRILKRFEREAKALARLSHFHIIKVIDYGEHDGSPYLVMEYMPGGTLKQCLGSPMPWQDAVKIIIPVAEALEYAHESNIIHRDIKPSNILLTKRGDPMLTDFGIAKILEDSDAATLTGTGIGVGTPEYMAPEQWTGQATAQSDIYSLGVVLYELVTGRKPYSADTPAAILLKQATEPLPRPGALVSGLPDPLEKVLIKALARRPEDRYLDMESFRVGLKKLLQGMDSEMDTAIPSIRPQPWVSSSDETGETRLQEETFGTRVQDATEAVISSVTSAVQLSSSEKVPLLPWSSAWWIVLGWVVGFAVYRLIFGLIAGEFFGSGLAGASIGLATALAFRKEKIIKKNISVFWIVVASTLAFSLAYIIALGRGEQFYLIVASAGLVTGCALAWVLSIDKAICTWRSRLLICFSWWMAAGSFFAVIDRIFNHLYFNIGIWGIWEARASIIVSGMLSGVIAGFVTVWQVRLENESTPVN